MKVEKIDYVWSVISVIIVGWSYRHRDLNGGLLVVYGMMLLLFLYHIFMIRRRMSGSVAVYGTIKDYHKNPARKNGWHPIVSYETEGGTSITSAYSVEWHEQYYDIGDEEMICYDPDQPEFFYFAGRENELVKDYFRFIVFGGALALALLVIRLAR